MSETPVEGSSEVTSYAIKGTFGRGKSELGQEVLETLAGTLQAESPVAALQSVVKDIGGENNYRNVGVFWMRGDLYVFSAVAVECEPQLVGIATIQEV